MKTSYLPLLAVLGILSLLGCGGESAGTPEDRDAEPAGATQTPPATEMGQGERTDLDDFLTEYEEFIDQYCEFTAEFAGANVSEMAALAEEMSAKGMKLVDYSNRAVALQASASAEAQQRLEEMKKKAEGCAEKMGG